MKNFHRTLVIVFLFLFNNCCIAGTDFLISDNYHSTQCKINNPKDWPTTFPDIIDCSKLSWPQAFDELHKKISREYAYTAWKDINWKLLYQKFKPIILKAYENNDKSTYYKAIREYLISIHDGHVWITPDTNDTIAQQFVSEELRKNIGGTYGLIISEINPQKFIVSYISPTSSELNRISLGDEIIAWNNVPIQQAIQQRSITWSDEFQLLHSSYNPATSAGIKYEKLRLLMHDSIGKEATITYINAKTKETNNVVLYAFGDNGETLRRTNLYREYNPDKLVDYKILQSGYGFLKISEEDEDTSKRVFQTSKEAIEYFSKNKVPGVILDLRGNLGGSDELTTKIAGLLTNNPTFYETASYYNKNTDHFEEFNSINVIPQFSFYTGPVIILTDLGTISSGEGIPMLAKKIPNLHTLSFSPNTQGSFGMNVPMIKLPGNFNVTYPIGRSLDQNNKIQVDGNNNLVGGVKTDVIIPMSVETAIDTYSKQKDILLLNAENCLRDKCWLSKRSE